MVALGVAVAWSATLHAQACSGGSGGGMDATGNECSGIVAAVEDGAKAAPRPIPKQGIAVSDSAKGPKTTMPAAARRSVPHARRAMPTQVAKAAPRGVAAP
jgi:hypothetical protein